MRPHLVEEWTGIALDAAELASKKALAAKDAVDPVKQAEREQAERNRTVRAEQERSAPAWLARLSPRRNRSREIAGFDERIQVLEQRQSELGGEIGQLDERLRQAPAEHQQRLAAWIAGGERGDRPLSDAPEVEALIADRRADVQAVQAVVEQVAAEKVDYVEKHRGRIVAAAAEAREAAHVRYRDLVHETRAARDELIEQRKTEIWAAVYPAAAAQEQAGFPGSLALGLKAPVAEALPATGGAQIPAPSVFELLEADADAIAKMATDAQAIALGHRQPSGDPSYAATWEGDPDHVEWRRRRQRELQEQGQFMTQQEMAEALGDVRD